VWNETKEEGKEEGQEEEVGPSDVTSQVSGSVESDGNQEEDVQKGREVRKEEEVLPRQGRQGLQITMIS